MKKLKKADYIIMAILVVIIAGVVLIKILGSGSDSKSTDERDTGNKKALVVTSDTAASADLEAPYKKFNGKKIGILTGSSYEESTFETFPDSEYMYFDTQSDMTLALDKGKIDGFITDEPVAKLACFENKNLGYYKNLII